jgi:hypothetical protein
MLSGQTGKLAAPGAFITLVVVWGYFSVSQLANADAFSAPWWKLPRAGGIILLILGITSSLAYSLVVYGYARTLKADTHKEDLYWACSALTHYIAANTTIAHESIGVHAWKPKGLFGVRRLVRIQSYRTARRPPTSITWTKGKGALGRCWAEGQTKLVNLEPIHKKAKTKQDFCEKLDSEERWGFSWSDFQTTQTYAAILATPIMKNGFRGCLSVDVRKPGHARELQRLWNDPAHNRVIDAHLDICYKALGVSR